MLLDRDLPTKFVAGAVAAALGGLAIGAVAAGGRDDGQPRTVVRHHTRVVTETVAGSIYTRPVVPRPGPGRAGAAPGKQESDLSTGQTKKRKHWKGGRPNAQGLSGLGDGDLDTGGSDGPESDD